MNLHNYASEGNVNEINALLKDPKVNVNYATPTTKRTPIMVAASEGQEKTFSFLLEHNANIYLTDKSNFNILHIIAYKLLDKKIVEKGKYYNIIVMLLSKEKKDLLESQDPKQAFSNLLENKKNNFGDLPTDCLESDEKERETFKLLINTYGANNLLFEKKSRSSSNAGEDKKEVKNETRLQSLSFPMSSASSSSITVSPPGNLRERFFSSKVESVTAQHDSEQPLLDPKKGDHSKPGGIFN